MSYPFKEIEERWQRLWSDRKVFKTPQDQTKPKYYVLDMFPYPSGQGLHVGHPEGYTATDIVARYKRMRGYNVLHPMGWDAFGLPAERYAMQTGIHPSITTKNNIDNFTKQLQSLGFSYDWDAQINTTDPDYYRFTQWIFLKIFNTYYDEKENRGKPISELPIPDTLKVKGKEKEKEDYINSRRLAYIAEMPVNWCEGLGTVLANEEVEEWVSKGYTVERRPMRQWMLRITAYASRLIDDLKYVEWPAGTLELQKNWIGRSEGAEVEFPLKDHKEQIKVFTTRADTLFGATYMVLAPEHSLVELITTEEQKSKVKEYVKSSRLKSEMERTVEGDKSEKSGVFTGACAVNPVNQKEIPVWIADYVLTGYGTGAIMAVPAHDERDAAFAAKYSLPVIEVVSPDKTPAAKRDLAKPFTGDGFSINSDFISGLTTSDAKVKMIDYLEKKGIGKRRINYKLRDWLFSRQRYWGEPIPISFDDKGFYHHEKEEELPLLLPESEDFQPAGTGESPLAKVKEWVEYKKSGQTLKRETNTMPQWAGSSWYYLRFIDPLNNKEFVSSKKEKYWMGNGGVDLYVGGSEHAVLHLLYSRFWHKVLYDHGYVSGPEPFKKLVHQGLILGEDGQKMSKSRGNVVNPDDVLKDYGADAFRLFEMFLGPLEQMKPWSSRGIEGVYRFLDRVWRLYTLQENDRFKIDPLLLKEPEEKDRKSSERLLHQSVKKVTEDIEKMSFNTAISQLMIFVNENFTRKRIGRSATEKFLLLLSPFAPHLAEELWSMLGHKEMLTFVAWPDYNPSACEEDEIEIVFQVNGKIRAKVKVSAEVAGDEESLKKAALADESVQKSMAGKESRKIIVVKNKLVNIVV